MFGPSNGQDFYLGRQTDSNHSGENDSELSEGFETSVEMESHNGGNTTEENKPR
ncbi:hypothetical protein ACP4OV_030384 [Aristida adscensionis]